jgi:peptide deformylase
MARPLVRYGPPVLQTPAAPVDEVNDDIRALIDEMVETMHAAPGIGLAAPQVGVGLRVCVIDLSVGRNPADLLTLVNPEFVERHGMQLEEEGCLSLPGVYAPVRRPTNIHVSAYDLSGQEISLDADGLLARVIQHENDHLDGVMFIDRVSQTALVDIQDKLDEFRSEFEQRRDLGEIPADAKIFATLAELEKLRC